MLEFTDIEREKAIEIVDRLRDSLGTALLSDDEEKLRRRLFDTIEEERVGRDVFGLNPILMAIQTAQIAVEDIGLRRDGLIATLLHPLVMEDVMTTEEVEEEFGEGPGAILDGLLRVRQLYAKTPVIETENFRNLLLSFAEDMRVILIMIADRVNIMREIRDVEDKEAQKRVAMEASYLYAPLAHKLGLYTLKSELEDLSLKYLEPDAYYHIKDKLSATKQVRDKYIADFIGPIKEKLEGMGLKLHMKGRTKSIYSIWQKMKKQKCPFEGVYDLFAIRVILETALDDNAAPTAASTREKMECWQVYSVVTDMYQPNPKRLRDWLSVPKSNGYESLHITVLGPEQKWVEVQIRTERMDEVAERGFAAHWRYKGVKSGGGMDDWLNAIRSALEAGDNLEVMDQLRMNMYDDEVYVFTPKGEIYRFPKEATILDFAYRIHSRVGNQCVGARVNGRHVKIDETLHSGDTIEILTSTNQTPKHDWLKVVATPHARTKIRKALKAMEAKEEEYVAVKEAKEEAREQNELQNAPTFVRRPTAIPDYIANKPSVSGTIILDRNANGLEYSFAKCCAPKPGDAVFAFLSINGGIKIHRETCPNATDLRSRYGYRIIKASWS